MNKMPSQFQTLSQELSKQELLVAAAMSGRTDIVKDIVSEHLAEIPPETLKHSAALAIAGGWKETAKALAF